MRIDVVADESNAGTARAAAWVDAHRVHAHKSAAARQRNVAIARCDRLVHILDVTIRGIGSLVLFSATLAIFGHQPIAYRVEGEVVEEVVYAVVILNPVYDLCCGLG